MSQRSAYYKELMQHASYAALNGTLAWPVPPAIVASFRQAVFSAGLDGAHGSLLRAHEPGSLLRAHEPKPRDPTLLNLPQVPTVLLLQAW